MKELGPIVHESAYYKIYIDEDKDVSIYSTFNTKGYWDFIGSGKYSIMKGLYDWKWTSSILKVRNLPENHPLDPKFKDKVEQELGIYCARRLIP